MSLIEKVKWQLKNIVEQANDNLTEQERQEINDFLRRN